jgi:hypothetical protein
MRARATSYQAVTSMQGPILSKHRLPQCPLISPHFSRKIYFGYEKIGKKIKIRKLY